MSNLDERLYVAYASTHAGNSHRRSTELIYRRDIRPYLPPGRTGARVLDIGAGQGELIRLLTADGFTARGIDISPEQVALAHAAGVPQVALGDFRSSLASAEGAWDAVIATDVLEHLDKTEVLSTLDQIVQALQPGGLFLARVPNAVSPTGGHIMYGDITHQTCFTRGSVVQLATVAGFHHVRTFACPPVPHGVPSALRAALWKPISGLLKLALAAETGRLRGHIVTHNLVFAAYRGPT